MKRWSKKIISLVMPMVMILALTACGGETWVPPTKEEAVKEEAKEEPIAYGEGNIFKNGDFSTDINGWSLYKNGGIADALHNDNEEYQVDIDNIGSVEHGVQIYHDGFAIREGGVYEVSFDVYATIEREFDWRIQVNGGDYHAYVMGTVKASPEKQTVTKQFTMEEPTDLAPRFCYNMGLINSMKEGTELPPHSIMIDNINMVVVDATNMIPDPDPIPIPAIKVNQLGYLPDAEKTAVFSDLSETDTTFKVVNVKNNKVVYTGEVSEQILNLKADEWNCYGDFSSVKKPGTYKVVTLEGEESYPFEIKKKLYDEMFDDVVKMLYAQRCGVECTIEPKHAACHLQEAVIYGTDKKIDVSGGWHDAGDYGRYVVPGAKTVADILLAYEKNPKVFSDKTGITESNNKIPDILDEAKYELDWMLKMQDAETGGVYHKVTCLVFPETVMPEEETDELFVAPISLAASGDFAAVMAMASGIYADIDADYAKTCLEAAKKAWTYIKDNIEDVGFKNPEEIVTGEYPDSRREDELFWASAELYKVTKEQVYADTVAELVAAEKRAFIGLGWDDVGSYGSYAWLTTEEASADAETTEKIRAQFDAYVEQTLEMARTDAYKAGIGRDFPWGSNMTIANAGMLFIMADEIAENAEAKKYVKAQLHYLLGVNATSYSFITGYGTLYSDHTHHRPSQVAGTTLKGMLVGGVNSNLEDPYAKAVLWQVPTAKAYADNEQSFSCNEVTIYWNSPLIYLLANEK